MADIKTREVIRGSIKTTDRAAGMMHRLKKPAVRTKAMTEQIRQDEDKDSSLQERTEKYAGSGALTSINAAEHAKEIIIERQKANKSLADKVWLQPDDETRSVDRQSNRNLKYRIFSKRTSEKRSLWQRNRGRSEPAHTQDYTNSPVQKKKRSYWIRAVSSGEGTSFVARIKQVMTGGTAARGIARSSRAAFRRTKIMNMTFSAGGAFAIGIIVMFTFFGSAFYSPGGENYSNDPTIWNINGNGSAALVKVAQKELGNTGGKKYWSWYGFGSHVHWCACFVSWCENECGYIQAGTAPKFAAVSDGANWFRQKGQWAGRSYMPKAGDLIYFDWDSDGELDHVGIVENSDGKTVHTIEGNSRNACRRQVYTKGRAPIAGYGLIFNPVSAKAQLINQIALEYAWSKGTSKAKYRYPSGSQVKVAEFAWKKYFPGRNNKAGCHEYVQLVLKECGYPTMPLNWGRMFEYFRSGSFKEIKVDYTEEQLRPGDIRIYRNSDGGYHIWIIVEIDGKLYKAQAARKKTYAHISGLGAGTRHSRDWLFRAK